MNRQTQCRVFGLASAVALLALVGSPVHAQETPQTANRFCDSIGINTHLSGQYKGQNSPYIMGTSYSFSNNVLAPLASLGVRHIRDYMAVDEDGLADPNQPNPGYEAVYNPSYMASSDTQDDYYNRLKTLGNAGIKCDLSMYAAGWEFQAGATDMARESQIITKTFLLGCQEAAEGANEWDAKGPGYINQEVPNVPAWQSPNSPPTWQATLNTETSNIWSAYRGDPLTAGIQIYSGTVIDVDGDPNVGNNPDTNGYVSSYGNVSGKVDYGSCHPYCYSLGAANNNPEYGVPRLIPGWQPLWGPAAPASPGPFVITETGYFTGSAANNVSAIVQEKYTLRTLLTAFNLGAYRTYLFELYDFGTDPADQEPNFGLIYNNGTVKPAYSALKSVIGLLGDASTSGSVTPLTWSLGGTTANVKHTLLQKSDGSYYLALWLGVASTDTAQSQAVTVTVPSTVAAGTLYTIDSSGSMSSNAVTIKSGTMSFNVTDTVSVLKLTGPSGLANGSFETPALGSGAYQYNPANAAWTFSSNSGIQSNGSAWSAANAPDGTQTAFLQSNGTLGSISQSVNLSSGNYKLTFQAARRSYGGAQPVQVCLDGVAQGSPVTPTSTSFSAQTVTITVSASGSHTLKLAATNSSGDNTTFVDSITLTQTSSSLANGSFETPALGSGAYQYNPANAAWTFSNNSGIQSNGSAWSAANAPDGTQTAFLQSNGTLGSISQSVNITSGNYKLTFQAALRPGGNNQSVQVCLDGVAQGSPVTPTSTSFSAQTVTITVNAAGSHTLKLAATNSSGDNTAFVDKITLMPQ